jgi:hypothetical protein
VWTDLEDLIRAGDVDPRDVRVAELRSIGRDEWIVPNLRGPGRRSRQNQCDDQGCGMFVSVRAERCGKGHWQKWAIRRGLDQLPESEWF